MEPEGWDEKSARLRETVTDVLKKYQSEAVWRTDETSLVCEFNTMEFDIHTLDENEHVSSEAHKETGPDRNGFIIRLSPLQVALRGQMRPRCGVSHGPYWQHYFANCDEYGQPFRLDILYGENTDTKLLKELTEKLNGQIGMFQGF